MKCYKILDKKTGLFKKRGNNYPHWTKTGDIFLTIGAAKCRVKWSKSHLRHEEDPEQWEIIEYELTQTNVIPVGVK